MQKEMKTIREAATALCDRWDTPLWKDVEHTAVLVHSLRTALAQPTSGDYALGYAEGFNDACKKPEAPNFCPRCGKRAQGVLGQSQVHTCTPPLWGHK